MKSVLLLAVFMFLAASMQLRTHLDDHIVGGFSGRKVNSIKDLDGEEKKAYNFIAENIDLSEYELVSTEHQVVAGMNYCFVFRPINENKAAAKKKAGEKEDTEICVWSQPWMNDFLQFTAPDGKVYRTGGYIPVPADDAKA